MTIKAPDVVTLDWLEQDAKTKKVARPYKVTITFNTISDPMEKVIIRSRIEEAMMDAHDAIKNLKK